jgi:hypothetical protein
MRCLAQKKGLPLVEKATDRAIAAFSAKAVGYMGMTDELNVGRYNHLTVIGTQFGNVDHQLKPYSQATETDGLAD